MALLDKDGISAYTGNVGDARAAINTDNGKAQTVFVLMERDMVHMIFSHLLDFFGTHTTGQGHGCRDE
jgi:hypothetical protein